MVKHFMKESWERQAKKNPGLHKESEEKVINRILNGRATIIHSIAGEIWKT